MPPGVNKLREALLDAVDSRDDAIRTAADTGAALMRRALAHVVTEAAKSGATQEHIDAAIASPEAQRALRVALAYAAVTADTHARTHSRLILGAGKGRDLGPITRKELTGWRNIKTERVLIAARSVDRGTR